MYSKVLVEGQGPGKQSIRESNYIGATMMLEIQIKSLDSNVVISLRGGIVIGQTEILREAIQSLPPTNSVVLDLTQVSIIDAHGLGVMLQLREKIQSTGARFELMNLSKPLRQILEITHLNSVFRINSKVGLFARHVGSHRAPVAA